MGLSVPQAQPCSLVGDRDPLCLTNAAGSVLRCLLLSPIRGFMTLLGSQGFEGLIPESLQCHPGSGASMPRADVTAQPAAVN